MSYNYYANWYKSIYIHAGIFYSTFLRSKFIVSFVSLYNTCCEWNLYQLWLLICRTDLDTVDNDKFVRCVDRSILYTILSPFCHCGLWHSIKLYPAVSCHPKRFQCLDICSLFNAFTVFASGVPVYPCVSTVFSLSRASMVTETSSLRLVCLWLSIISSSV